MKKEELLKKVTGLSDDLAESVIKAYEGYVPKSRFDEVNEAKKNAEALVKERDNQIEALKKAEDSAFLFNVPNPNPKKIGVTPKIDNDRKPSGTITKEQFGRMSYKERVELFNNDRELYDSLVE